MNCSTPGFPIHHQLPELTQTHAHRISDAIQPFHPLPSPSPPAFNLSHPVSGSFPMSQLFASSHQRIGVSASASVLLMNIQDWIHLGWTGWISPCSPRDSQESSPTPQFKNISSSVLSFIYGPILTSIHDYWKNQSIAFFMVQLSHPDMTTGKTRALTRWTFVGKVMSLLLNMLSRLVIIFLSRSKRLLISWLQSPSAVILEPPKIKSVTVSIVSPSVCHERWDQMPWS